MFFKAGFPNFFGAKAHILLYKNVTTKQKCHSKFNYINSDDVISTELQFTHCGGRAFHYSSCHHTSTK